MMSGRYTWTDLYSTQELLGTRSIGEGTVSRKGEQWWSSRLALAPLSYHLECFGNRSNLTKNEVDSKSSRFFDICDVPTKLQATSYLVAA
jgi:hypothetical protein